MKRKAENGLGGEKAKRSKDEVIATPFNHDLLESDSEDGEGSDTRAVSAGQNFNINEEYAKRFEHNKKREELQRCKFDSW